MQALFGLMVGLVLGSVVAVLYSRLKGQNNLLQVQSQFEQERLQARTEFEQERLLLVRELESWKAKHQALEQSHEQTEDHLQTMRKENEDLTQKMTQQFELVTQKLFEEKSSKFTDQNYKSLQVLLEPFKERLKDFERKVEETYKTESTDRGMLRGELSKLVELNRAMATDAQNLTKALKGDVKVQGNWGEMILENILERSGLRKGEEYIVQGQDLGTLKNEDGDVIRPDVIVKLPEEKHLILDSKMTLQAYESYASAENQDDKERFEKLHVESLKKHIDGLSSKKYTSSEELQSPEFVLLFMPLEPAFALAMRVRPELFQYAWEKNIAIVSPTTLLTSLRTVSSLWKQDRQQKNAIEIARRGGALYDKFCGLIDDLEGLGDKFDQTQKVYNDIVSKLSEGRGNLISQVEDLKELGAKTERKLKRIEVRDLKLKEKEERRQVRQAKKLTQSESDANSEIESNSETEI